MRVENERLREENSSLRQEATELRQQLEEHQEGYRERLSEWNIERLRLQAQMNELRSKTPSEDLEVVRDRILSNLNLGTQAPGYKTARKLLDRFIKALGSIEG